MHAETLMSVGIDVGTSTTQVVFSRLTIQNVAGSVAVPRIAIVDKQIDYRSPIHFTPLLSPTVIDTQALKTLVLNEYANAGYSPSDIDTGAAIITGETARAENAEQVLDVLSNLAGDFVVSTAGPHVESILAARGSGLDTYSEHTSNRVANLDIGGGTTNIAVYQHGQPLGTACLDIGGRLVRANPQTIEGVAAPIAQLAAAHGIRISPGDPTDLDALKTLAKIMARQLAMAIGVLPRDGVHPHLYTNHGAPLPLDIAPTDICFTGGVSDLINHPEAYTPLQFGDIGVLLGQAIAHEPAFTRLTHHLGSETIGATVVGAGIHTTELSGSTIEYALSCLPLRNVPIAQIPASQEADPARLAEAITQAIHTHHPDHPAAAIALALTGAHLHSFEAITAMACAIINGAREVLEGPNPLVIIIQADRAKALGQSIAMLRGQRDDVICIDSVHTEGGDYIDIATPVGSGRAIPVVIKTLVFNDRHGGEA